MTARCPRCGRETHTAGDMPHVWYCHQCQMYFGDDDDGDVGYGRPEKRLEREERAKERQQQRPRR